MVHTPSHLLGSAPYQLPRVLSYVWLVRFALVLELPGQRRVRFFNTSPPLSVVFPVLAFFPSLILVLIVTVVLESSDQRRVRILSPSTPTVSSKQVLQRSCIAKMSLLSREQVLKSWYTKNPSVGFLDLLYALEQHKSISTEYGLNVSVHQHWRFGDPP